MIFFLFQLCQRLVSGLSSPEAVPWSRETQWGPAAPVLGRAQAGVNSSLAGPCHVPALRLLSFISIIPFCHSPTSPGLTGAAERRRGGAARPLGSTCRARRAVPGMEQGYQGSELPLVRFSPGNSRCESSAQPKRRGQCAATRGITAGAGRGRGPGVGAGPGAGPAGGGAGRAGALLERAAGAAAAAGERGWGYGHRVYSCRVSGAGLG